MFVAEEEVKLSFVHWKEQKIVFWSFCRNPDFSSFTTSRKEGRALTLSLHPFAHFLCRP